MKMLAVLAVAITFILSGCAGTTSPTVAPTPDARIAEIRTSFQENFAGTSWYQYVSRFDTSGKRLVIGTTLRPAQTADASAICSAASGYVFSNLSNYDFTGVIVRDRSGEDMIRRTSITANCTP